MKLNRAQFLKALPAAALVLAGCTVAPTAPADTDALVFDHAYPLDYATQFTADCYADGSTLLTIPDAQAKFLVRPEGAATLRTVPEGVTVLQQPVQNIYLVSTSAMDLFLHLDALDSIALSGTRAEGWYLDEAKQAMQSGRIAYAGKYSAPDYERILTAECGLAVENTMIYHTPEVKEQLERFGIPVLVERSSYESSPLARMEWIKLYGILLGKEALAEEVFAQQAQRIAPLLKQPSTGKRCAFFSITSSGLATVRKSGDYVAQMIGMAGGEYVFADLADSGNSLSTMNIPLEDLYAGRRCAHLQRHHRRHHLHKRRAACPLRIAGRMQGGAKRRHLVHDAQLFPAEHGAGRFYAGSPYRFYRGNCRPRHPAFFDQDHLRSRL